MKVSIITPTTGNPHLVECVRSVKAQTYQNIQHIVVVDGEERWQKADPLLLEAGFPSSNKERESVIILPHPTGTNRYNGHRIYGAMTFIAEGDYHIWLDDDNVLEPTHVESLVKLVQEKNLHWAFSLRKIIDKDNNFLCLDDCESLGLWASVLAPDDFFIDVNCYFVKRELATQIAPIWYRKFREPGQLEVDRAIAKTLMAKQNNLKFDCTRDYTVQYRVANTGLSVQGEFFLDGNKKMLEKYNGVLPWKS